MGNLPLQDSFVSLVWRECLRKPEEGIGKGSVSRHQKEVIPKCGLPQLFPKLLPGGPGCVVSLKGVILVK